MPDPADRRGVLYPAKLPTFHRHAAPGGLREVVAWFWVPRWDLAPGRTSRQRLLPFPASNLVVEPGGVSLAGPATGASHRDLRGRGWAVGALLRPAGIAALCPDPGVLRDDEVRVEEPGLHRDVAEAMADPDEERGRHRAVEVFAAWAASRLPEPDENGRLANALEELVSGDRTIVRVDQLAGRLGVSVRGLQRLTRRYVGLPPLTVIRRYRLQEAAQRLRDDRTLTIARVAADLGYADHAHLAADFRHVLGVTPDAYRRGS